MKITYRVYYTHLCSAAMATVEGPLCSSTNTISEAELEALLIKHFNSDRCTSNIRAESVTIEGVEL